MTRREDLKSRIAEIDRLVASFRTMADNYLEEVMRLTRFADAERKKLAALPPDPPPFRVSDAVSRKALEARCGRPTLGWADISERDRAEHAALIQAWVEEQFPYGKDLCSITAIRAKAGLT